MKNEYWTKQLPQSLDCEEILEVGVLADTLEEAESIILKLGINGQPYFHRYFDVELGIYKVRDTETNLWFEQRKGEK